MQLVRGKEGIGVDKNVGHLVDCFFEKCGVPKILLWRDMPLINKKFLLRTKIELKIN